MPPPESTSADRANPVSMGDAALLGLLATAATVALSIVRSKTTALILGPSGLGITAEVLQLVTLAQAPAAMFGGAALVSKLSSARADGNGEAIDRLYNDAWVMSAVIASITGAIAVAAGFWLLPSPWGRGAWPLTALAATGGALGILAFIPSQVLIVFGKLRVLTILGIATGFVQTLLLVAGTISFGLAGQFVAIAAGPLAAIALSLWMGSTAIPELRWRPRAVLDLSFAAEVVRFGVTALLATLGLQAALFVVRIALERKGGPALNGQFQAAWALGGAYFGFILTSIGTYSFPRFAAARSQKELAGEVSRAARFVLRVAPPAVLAMIALRAPLVQLLYSSRFEDAVPLMGVMMVGDLARAIVWLQHGPLLYRGHLASYLIVEILGVVGLALGGVLLIPWLGLAGFGYAYTGTYLLLMPISSVALRFATGVALGWRPTVQALAATALLAAAALLSSTLLGRSAVLLAALAWAHFSGLLRDGLGRLRLAILKQAPPTDPPPLSVP